jgi:hypothetical protein
MKTIRQLVLYGLVALIAMEVLRYTAFDVNQPGFAAASAKGVTNIILLAVVWLALQLFKGKSRG